MNTWLSTILYLTSNAIHVYAIFIFIDVFLGRYTFRIAWKVASYVSYFLLGSLVWLTTKNSSLNILMNTIPLFLVTIPYITSWKKRVFSVVLSCSIGMFIDWIAFALFENAEIIKVGFFQCVVLLICASIFSRFYRNKPSFAFHSSYSWFLVLISIGTILVGFLTVNEDSSKDYIIAIVLLLINFLNFYIYNMEQRSLEEQHKIRLIENANYAYQNQLQTVNETQKKIKFMRHDFKKHIHTLQSLIEKEDLKGALEYLEEMEESVIVKKSYSETGNKEIDSIINYELTLAEEIGTNIICNVNLPDTLRVSTFDMTIILGNLLDNAVHALKSIDKKILIVEIRYNKGIIRIDIENTYNPKSKKKDNGKEHGIGLLSVENALIKYHGKLESYPETSRWHTTAAFYNSLDYES